MTTVVDLVFMDFKIAVQANFAEMIKGDLFQVDLDRDKIFQIYLDAFPDQYRAEYNCNCCKSFLRQHGGIVTIKNNKTVSIWDNLKLNSEFTKVAKALSDYIHSLDISDVYLTDSKRCGTDKTKDGKRPIIWQHFYFEAPNKVISNNIDFTKGANRTDKELLKRALDELTRDSVETVLDLIGQNSLYRGKEHEVNVFEFKKLQSKYQNCENKDLFCWEHSIKTK